ncbi:MAG: hypothetical protein RIC94_05325 [Phycisphaerales bacterium]|jgi:hypothetical protein
MDHASTDHCGDEAPRRDRVDASSDRAIRVAQAIGALWECSALYEPGHPSFEHALQECRDAMRGVREPLIFRVLDSGLTIDGAEDRQIASGLARTLRSRSIVGLSLHRPASRDALVGLVRVLGSKDLTPSQVIEQVFSCTEGAVRAFQPSERTAAHPADDGLADDTGDDRAVSFGGARSAAVASMPSEVRQTLERLRASASEASDPTDGGESGDSIQWFQHQFHQMESSHQRQLLQALSAQDSVTYEQAAFALSQVPLTNLTDAMAVLARKDSQISETSLLLLRRLADLAVGSSTDLRSLASIATRWLDDGSAATPGQERAARVSAEILERKSRGEFRSESYSVLLDRMLSSEALPPTPIGLRLEDEQSSLSALATEIICDLAESPPDDDIDVSNLYEILTHRAARLASDGRFDTLQRIIRLATATSRKGASKEQRRAAHALLEIASREQWLADALARCPSALILTEQLALHRERGGDALDFLLDVARRTQSSGVRAAVIDASRKMPSGELVDRCILLADADPADAVRLAFLVAEHDADQMPTLLRSALLGADATSREHAFRLMERLGGTWPRALIIRALSDENDEIRLIGAQAAIPHHVGVLIERLRGDVGSAAPGIEEARRLALIMDRDRSDSLTNDIARWTLRRFAFSLRTDALNALVSVLSRRPQTRLSRLALQAARLRIRAVAPDQHEYALQRRTAA